MKKFLLSGLLLSLLGTQIYALDEYEGSNSNESNIEATIPAPVKKVFYCYGAEGEEYIITSDKSDENIHVRCDQIGVDRWTVGLFTISTLMSCVFNVKKKREGDRALMGYLGCVGALAKGAYNYYNTGSPVKNIKRTSHIHVKHDNNAPELSKLSPGRGERVVVFSPYYKQKISDSNGAKLEPMSKTSEDLLNNIDAFHNNNREFSDFINNLYK